MNKDKINRLQTAKNTVKALAVANTAVEFNRSNDWVYRVLRGDLDNKNTNGVREYFEKEYMKFQKRMKK